MITNQNADHIREHATIEREPAFDLGQHLFDTINSMNKLRMMELGIPPAAPSVTAPRVRQLDVRDDHLIELLAATGDLIASRRRAGMEVGLPALEINAAILAMVKA